MSADVASPRALLVLALQDLFDAEAAQVERLPRLREHVRDEALDRLIGEDADRSAAQHGTLAAIVSGLGADPDGPRNIWQRGILDDADNDTETVARGPLLDIALAGALRKAKQAERVSYETALALAERLGRDADATRLRAIRDEEQSADDALAELLVRLCGGLEDG